MKIVQTKKIAQMFYPFALYNIPNITNPQYVYDEHGKPICDGRGIQVRTKEPDLKDKTHISDSELKTITPDDITKNYLVDAQEEEGEPPTEVEEEIIESEEYPEFGTFFQAFQWATNNKEVIRIYYITVSGIFIIRDIEPHGDFWARTTLKRILVTWDETISDIRAFRLENVQKYEFKGDRFTPKFNFIQRKSEYKKRIKNRRGIEPHDQWI